MTQILYFTYIAMQLDKLIIGVIQPIWHFDLLLSWCFSVLECHFSCNYIIDCNMKVILTF